MTKDNDSASGAARTRIKAATLLSLGFSEQKTADIVGVSRSTIQRYKRNKEFTDLMATFREVEEQAFKGAAMEERESAAASFKRDIERYREKRQGLYLMQIDTATELLHKVNARIQDLPEDSIMPQQLAGLLGAISSVSENAFNGWAQMIGIDELSNEVENLKMTLEEEFAVEADAAGVEISD